MRLNPLLDLQCIIRTKSGAEYRGHISAYHQEHNEVVMDTSKSNSPFDTLTIAADCIESVQYNS
jgi:small nuclear ribonucleoprotein (snRNP)-like protein